MILFKLYAKHGWAIDESTVEYLHEGIAVVECKHWIFFQMLQELIQQFLLELGSEIFTDKCIMETIHEHPIFGVLGNHLQVGEWQLLWCEVDEKIADG